MGWLDQRRFDVSLLMLRVGAGGTMLLAHGLPKLLAFSARADSFSDPLGVGSFLSLILAIGAEAFCALLVVLGIGTRLATLPLVATMLVAAFVVHGDDPFGKKELALAYALMFGCLGLTGAGAYRVPTNWLRVLQRWS